MYIRLYYGVMMIKFKVVDSVVGGLIYLIVDILCVVFKCIGVKLGIKIIFSVIVMYKDDE